MKKRYVWELYDKDNNLIIRGVKKEVTNKCYVRYVYGHIFDDILIRTNEIYIK